MTGEISINVRPNKGLYFMGEAQGDRVYVPVVGGKELSMVCESEDVAMLVALGYKYDGADSRFAKMACRMLNIESAWAK